jgi:threonine/homoserine/homoserine lactone efflux protein
MAIDRLLLGILIGLMVAVPVGPLGLLCLNRSLATGRLYGLVSGLAVATADALAAGMVALGISLISGFLTDHQVLLRLVGGVFLCYLGWKIYRTEPKLQQSVSNNVHSLLGVFITTVLLTFSYPVTILSFIAIYAGWGVESLSGHYFGAALLTLGVFIGSSLWWIALFVGLTVFHDRFSLGVLAWIHRVSGAVIAGFGCVILLSILPIKTTLGIYF